MDPIIKISVAWRRLGQWVFFRVIWFPFLIIDGLDGDMGSDASLAYAGVVSISVVGIGGIVLGIVGLVNAGHFLFALALSFAGYFVLGMIACGLLRKSGYFDRVFPQA